MHMSQRERRERAYEQSDLLFAQLSTIVIPLESLLGLGATTNQIVI